MLVVGALVVWCVSRWDAWFHNPEEEPYEASEMPARVLLTFGDEDGMTSRNVSWICGSEVREASVELMDMTDSTALHVDAVGEVFESRSGKAAYYVARLRALKAGHTYRYRVWTGDQISDWYAFHMPTEENQETSFLFMGDIQDSIGGIANQLLREAIRRNPEVEFFVQGGDLTERPTDAYWAETFETLDSVGQAMPVLTVTGNHDYLKNVVCTLERRFSLIHSYFLDSMEGVNQVFTVRYKNMQLFCLDSNREFFYLWTQREWLEKKLEESSAKWKVVVLHHPLYSTKGKTNNLIQRWMFDDLIRLYGVDLVLQGHEHVYGRTSAQTLNSQHPTPIYTVSHCSPKNYKTEFPDGYDKFEKRSRYYQTVSTHGDTLFVIAKDANTQRTVDSLYIEKNARIIIHE